ncbi:MAG: hypothetical protein FWE90_05865 [Defluviitaleaceae bacterium]|nr:hypothetical protein [Defluviitaleaceae bacterium]
MAELFTYALAFPFAPVGAGLRWLSLSGGAGNVIAWAIYLAIGLSPFVILAVLVRKRGSYPEDILLAALGFLLFAVMYYMVNPGAMTGNLRMFPPAVGHMLMGGAIWSVVTAYGLLRFVRRVLAAGEGALARYFRLLLSVLVAVLAVAVITGLVNLFAAAGNTRSGIDAVFLVGRHLIDILPNALNIWVVHAALRLSAAMRDDAYGEGSVSTAQRMSRVCAVALAVTLVSVLSFNIGQFLFAARLSDIHIEIMFPLVPILFVTGALLFARYIVQGKALKDENEGFV